MSSLPQIPSPGVSAFAPRVEYLRVTDLHAFYGESHILHGIDFTVDRGELVTLLGRNGAGRTTTLKAILGLVGDQAAPPSLAVLLVSFVTPVPSAFIT